MGLVSAQRCRGCRVGRGDVDIGERRESWDGGTGLWRDMGIRTVGIRTGIGDYGAVIANRRDFEEEPPQQVAPLSERAAVDGAVKSGAWDLHAPLYGVHDVEYF